MTLAEFRRLTAHLGGTRELLAAGASVGVLWHDEVGNVSIDDDETLPPTDGVTVLFRETAPEFEVTVTNRKRRPGKTA